MPFYHRLGQLPHKRHTQFRKPDGGLYREEVMGLEGFSSLASILYHNFIPPRVKHVEDLGSRLPETVDFGPIRHRAFRTTDAPLGSDPVSARIPLLANRDVILGVSRASQSMDYFYRNAQAYETWWVHEGSGTFKSQFGNLKFRKGDYIVIPFGTTWQMQLDDGEARFFTIENPIGTNSGNCSNTRPTLSGISACQRILKLTPSAATSKCVLRCATGSANTFWITTRSTWSAGMVICIPGSSTSRISNRSRDASTSHRQFIKPSRHTTSSCARLSRVSSTTIRRASLRHTTTLTSIQTKSSTTRKATSCRAKASTAATSACIPMAYPTVRSPA
jgi:hypothetical protein